MKCLTSGVMAVAGVIHLDFSITGIDSQTLLIPEKGIARFVLAAG